VSSESSTSRVPAVASLGAVGGGTAAVVVFVVAPSGTRLALGADAGWSLVVELPVAGLRSQLRRVHDECTLVSTTVT